MDTPGEWQAGITTANYYIKHFRTEKIINPFLLATEIDLLTSAVQRSSKDLSLLYRSFDVLIEAIDWVLKDYPKLFRNKDLYEAMSACFDAIVVAAQLPDRLERSMGVSAEEQENWAGFITLLLVLYRFRDDVSVHTFLLQGLETAAARRPWIYRMESEDLMEILFRNTHSDVQALRTVSLRLLVSATQNGASQYLRNRLISNLILHVLPDYPDILPALEALLLSAQTCPWSSPAFSEELKRLKTIDVSALPTSLRNSLKSLLGS